MKQEILSVSQCVAEQVFKIESQDLMNNISFSFLKQTWQVKLQPLKISIMKLINKYKITQFCFNKLQLSLSQDRFYIGFSVPILIYFWEKSDQILQAYELVLSTFDEQILENIKKIYIVKQVMKECKQIILAKRQLMTRKNKFKQSIKKKIKFIIQIRVFNQNLLLQNQYFEILYLELLSKFSSTLVKSQKFELVNFYGGSELRQNRYKMMVSTVENNYYNLSSQQQE